MKSEATHPFADITALHGALLGHLTASVLSSFQLAKGMTNANSADSTAKYEFSHGKASVSAQRTADAFTFNAVLSPAFYRAHTKLAQNKLVDSIKISFAGFDGVESEVELEPKDLAGLKVPQALSGVHAQFQAMIQPFVAKPNEAVARLLELLASPSPLMPAWLNVAAPSAKASPAKPAAGRVVGELVDLLLEYPNAHPVLIKGELMAAAMTQAGERYKEGLVVLAEQSKRYVLVSRNVSNVYGESLREAHKVLTSDESLKEIASSFFGPGKVYAALMRQMGVDPTELIS